MFSCVLLNITVCHPIMFDVFSALVLFFFIFVKYSWTNFDQSQSLTWKLKIFFFHSGVNVSTSVDTQYLEAVDSDKYLKAVNFSVLQCINDVVIPNITQCPELITPAALVSPSMYCKSLFLKYTWLIKKTVTNTIQHTLENDLSDLCCFRLQVGYCFHYGKIRIVKVWKLCLLESFLL